LDEKDIARTHNNPKTTQKLDQLQPQASQFHSRKPAFIIFTNRQQQPSMGHCVVSENSNSTKKIMNEISLKHIFSLLFCAFLMNERVNECVFVFLFHELVEKHQKLDTGNKQRAKERCFSAFEELFISTVAPGSPTGSPTFFFQTIRYHDL